MSDTFYPRKTYRHRIKVGGNEFIVSSWVDGDRRVIREVEHCRRHRRGGTADVRIFPNGGRKPSATLAELWSHLGVDADARWKECPVDHPAFPARRAIRSMTDDADDARKGCAASATLISAGWVWVDDGAGHWEPPPATQQQPGQAVAWYTDDRTTDRSATTYDPVVAQRWRDKGWPVGGLFDTPQTPDGYVLVPREPTEAMIDAAMDQPVGAVWGYCGNRDDASLDDAKRVWAAMIAASEASGGE